MTQREDFITPAQTLPKIFKKNHLGWDKMRQADKMKVFLYLQRVIKLGAPISDSRNV